MPVALPRWRVALAIALGTGGLVGLLLAREPLSHWLWPDTRLERLQSEAEQALRRGELTREDGRGARELYAAALALDPDRAGAREGLASVGRAALEQARVALANGRDDDARKALALARELAVPRADVQALERELRRGRPDSARLEALLAGAHRARVEGRLDGAPDAALPLYLRVLEAYPNHTPALEGREDTLSDLLQSASGHLEAGRLAEAEALVRRVREVDGGHVDLPRLLAALADATEDRLGRADADLSEGRFSRALEGYQVVERVDPGNLHAARGRIEVANAYAARSERYATDMRFVPARADLLEAQAIAPDAPAVVAARRHLAGARLAQATGQPRGALRLEGIMEAATAAEARANIFAPPGASAYDHWRQARALAPDASPVRTFASRLLPQARQCFEDALRDNRLASAGECLDAYGQLEVDPNTVRAARRRLAQRWIAVGDERLGAGELAVARRALDTARALDPAAPGLDAFGERVGTASRAVR